MVDPQEFGALQARMDIMTSEMHKLRESMEKIQSTLDRGQGGLMVIMFTIGVAASAVTLFIKSLFEIK